MGVSDAEASGVWEQNSDSSLTGEASVQGQVNK